jgi:serine phosphatase RsbU (regulator of sigma subunit)
MKDGAKTVEPGPVAMQCSEVWGGNDAADRAVSMPSLDAWVMSRPVDESASGGDIHYLSSCISGKISRLMLADVAGHGSGVADVSHRLRAHLRRFASEFDQRRLMERLNAEFAAVAEGGVFATAVLATCYGPTGELEISSAGHPPPLWYRVKAGRWGLLPIEAAVVAGQSGGEAAADNIPLGIFTQSTYSSLKTKVAKGDLLLFYTDGVIESKDPGGRLLGVEGLIGMLQEIDVRDASGIIPALLTRLGAWAGEPMLSDDATMLLMRLTTAPRTKGPLGVIRSIVSGAMACRWAWWAQVR